jgi:hypothetical protein
LEVESMSKERYTEMKDLYRDAVLIQNASNVSGVVLCLREMLIALTHMGLDEREKRQHPAVLAVLYKVMDMCDVCENGSYLYDKYLEAEREDARHQGR